MALVSHETNPSSSWLTDLNDLFDLVLPQGGNLPRRRAVKFSSSFAECTSHRMRWLLVLSGLVLAMSLQVFAQEATVVGTVTDPTGAALPNVSVTLTNTDTGLSTKATTSADGQYVAPNLHIGHYTVNLTVSGFRPAEKRGLVLN